MTTGWTSYGHVTSQYVRHQIMVISRLLSRVVIFGFSEFSLILESFISEFTAGGHVRFQCGEVGFQVCPLPESFSRLEIFVPILAKLSVPSFQSLKLAVL